MMLRNSPETDLPPLKLPPTRSTGIFSDIRNFLLAHPQIPTRVSFDTEADRQLYTESILQRTGIDAKKYRLLNIHRIGIETPAHFVFDELLKWNGDSSCWPNHIAYVRLIDNALENIQINLFGNSFFPFRRKCGKSGVQLFRLKAIRIQRIPEPFDFDNARFLLYECSGGYPIGIFTMYVRTSIPERGETALSQLFIVVGFNFYGKTSLSGIGPLNHLWEHFHNRVTANIANRFKQLCEWRFEKFCRGDIPAGP